MDEKEIHNAEYYTRGLQFERTGKGYAVTGITTNTKDIIIPSTYQGVPIVKIARRAFYANKSILTVEIPDSVTSIGDDAFNSCSKLEKVTIEGNSRLTEIGDKAFFKCTHLTNITIPDGVTYIGDWAFYGCTNIVEATMPATAIKHIPNAALETVVITSGTSIDEEAFDHCYCLTNISIPDSVTSIGNYAFSSCDFTSITIPNSVTSIGKGAFIHCSDLTDITIPDSVTRIRGNVFQYCEKLSSITIPDSVTSIDMMAFYECDGLTNVYFTGTEEQWNNITIGSSNSPLTNATIIYNYQVKKTTKQN